MISFKGLLGKVLRRERVKKVTAEAEKRITPEKIRYDPSKFTFLLDLHKSDVDLAQIGKIAQENGFDEKKELHVTVLGFKNGAIIKEALKKLGEEERAEKTKELQVLISKFTWKIKCIQSYFSIEKKYEDGLHKMSYIQMVEVPDLKQFFSELNSLLGLSLEMQPPHVTLFTNGSDRKIAKDGIGINTQEDFNTLNPQPIKLE